MPLSKLLVKTLVLVLLISFFLLFPQTNVVYLFICYLSKSFSEPLWYKYEDSSKFKDLFIHGRFGECLEPTFLYAWGEVTTLKVFARGKKKIFPRFVRNLNIHFQTDAGWLFLKTQRGLHRISQECLWLCIGWKWNLSQGEIRVEFNEDLEIV